MAYKRTTRKWGEGYTTWLAHSTGAGYDSSGEALIDTLLTASATFGAYSEGSELIDEAEVVEDQIAQESVPIQTFVVGRKATFKVKMSLGDAVNLAVAAGLAAVPGSTNTTGMDAHAIPLGPWKPQFLSLLHKVRNPHDSTKHDYIYMPRVQVDGKILLAFMKKQIREAEVTFYVLASQQDMMKDEFGNGRAIKVYYETSATFDKVLRFDATFSTPATQWDLAHDFGYKTVGVQCTDTTDAVYFEPGDTYNLTSAWTRLRFSSNTSGKAVAFAAGVSSEDASTGESEVHEIHSESVTWDVTAKNFSYGDALVVICLDEFGKVIEPGQLTITPGGIGTGSIAALFYPAKKGKMLVFNAGPNGDIDTSHASGTSWTITATGATIPALIQAWDSSHRRIIPASISYDAGTETFTLTFSTAVSGYSKVIY